MKNIILSFFLASLSFSLLAQTKDTTILYAGIDTTISLCPQGCANLKATVVPNKGTSTYKVDTTITYNPDPFNGGTQIPLADFKGGGDDGITGLKSIGFTFCFFGIPYTQFAVSTNGWITFTDGQTTASKKWQTVPIPDATAPLNAIMGPWHDLVSGGSIYYNVYGTAPNRRLVVSWYKSTGSTMSFYAGCGAMCIKDYTGQIVIYETTNNIDMFIDHKKPPKNLTALGIAHVQGIQNKDGTVAYTRSGRNSTIWPRVLPDITLDAVRFIPDGPPDYKVQWFKTDTAIANKIADTTVVKVCPTATTSYIARLTYACPPNSFLDTMVVKVTGGSFPATAAVVSQPTCGQANGSVKVTVTGGTPNYDYVWRKDSVTGSIVSTVTGSAGTTNTVTNLAAGKYYITASESKGCKAIDSIILTSTNAPTSTFTVTSPVCVNANSTITYTGNAGGTASYAWSFDGGTIASGTGKGPYSVNWATSGTKNITLTVTENGCPSAQTDTAVTVNPIPTSSFTTTTVCTNANATITYTGSASSTATYTWNFNGGTATPGTGQGSHQVTWATSGIKNLTLTVTENGCTSILTTVTDTVNAIPTSAFKTTSPVCVNANSTITYIGTASSSATYTWTFNGGTISSGTGQGPYQVNWATSGAKDVTLTVTENGCTSPLADSIVNVNPIPPSTFTVNSPVCVKSNSTITYASSADSSATYTWNFNGGTTASGTGKGPYQVNWATSGTKNITLTVTEKGCTSAVTTVPVTVNPKPDTTFTVVSPVCVNQNSTITYTGTASAGAAFVWGFSGGNTVSGTGKGPYAVNWTTNGNKNITLKITDNGCSDSAAKTVNVNPNLNIPITGDTNICKGDSTLLTASGATKYNWNTGDTTVSITVKPTMDSTFSVSGSNAFCSGKNSIKVTVNTPPVPNVGPDLKICFGKNIALNSSGNASYIYSWTPATMNDTTAISPTANPKTTTIYVAKVTDKITNCVGYDTVQVTVNPLPSVDAGPDVTITSEESTTLTATTVSQGKTFVWTPETGLSTPNNKSTNANPQITTRYRVILTDTNGCIATDSVVVYKTCGDLYIPNAFSPNGDSLNDVFAVYQIGYTKINMYIFDRWGEKIYEMDSFDKPWDGKVNSEIAQQDVYVYVADAWDCFGQKQKYIGRVTLIR